MGRLVKQFKPGGSGTPNNGNAARSFFFNYRKSARIAGVNESPILRFYVSLQNI
jgi:hypothetical protein